MRFFTKSQNLAMTKIYRHTEVLQKSEVSQAIDINRDISLTLNMTKIYCHAIFYTLARNDEATLSY
ncbi:hypothetical protein [Helicobacter sp. T3_23-1056]